MKKTKNITEKKKAGAPTLYKSEYCKIAEAACKNLGADDKSLAKLFSVTPDSITKWKDKYPEFLLFIKKGRDEYDVKEVEKSLRMRATGYEYTETTQKQLKNKEGEISTEILVAKKRMAPDTGACIFWLVNRNPDRWKHVQRTIIQGDTKNPVNHIHSAAGDINIVSDPIRTAEVKKILQEAGAFKFIQDSDTTMH